MKYSTNSLAGKLILFFGIMTLGIVAFALYLAWGTGQIRHTGRELEQVYFPLTETLESLESNLDIHSYALKQASVEKKALKEHASEWATLINPQLKFVRDKIPMALNRSTTTTDSLMEVINLYQEQERLIMNWINANYVNASMDSAFLASLPSREQSELVPLVNGLEAIERQYKNHIDQLKSAVGERLHQYAGQVTRISDRMKWIGVGIAILILALVIGGGMWLIKKFYRSVSVSSSILERLVKGEVSDYVEPSADELGVIVASANKLSGNLKQYSSFAQSIGDGSVDFQFKPVSDGDVLGNSLVQMKQKLKTINEEDKKRSWVTEGLATFADIMRRSDDYEELASLIVS
ncbi:MAG TPA: hypothetical protein VFV79_09020, partial [Saprospiraceae bacterium]|nr:hypothetical protein [Saprospiraceae bacterium]